MHFYIERQIGLHSVKKNKAIKNTYHLLIDSMTTIVKLFAQKKNPHYPQCIVFFFLGKQLANGNGEKYLLMESR